MRSRVRPPLTPAELAGMYGKPHRHDLWPDHVMRVAATVELIRELVAYMTRPPVLIADLSCGDAAIARAVVREFFGGETAGRVMLGDLAPGYEFHGPIETTISQVTHADLFICTETLEHLEDPDAVLRQIRDKADVLVMSTPDAEPPGVNPEHLWTWNQDDVREMLAAAGWTPVAGKAVSWTDENKWAWAYQIWGCT